MVNDTSKLIADSGSTKTDWVVLQSGQSPIQFQSAGLNPFYQSGEEIESTLRKQVLNNIPNPIEEVFFYGAGCADEKSSFPIFKAIKATFGSDSAIQVGSDMLGAARGLCGKQEGIACILGTGANNALYKDGNIVYSIGSLGFWMGDEGSGSYLGKQLVVDYLQNDLPADLHHLFAQTFPEINRMYVLDYAYKKPFPNRYFATFSKFISDYIHLEYMHNLVQHGFRLFVQKYVLKHTDAHLYPVHFTGSVAFHYQAILKQVLEENHLKCGQIQKTPLQGLVSYHA
jgi:glucosamine kinase